VFNHRLPHSRQDEVSTAEFVETVTPVALLQARQSNDLAVQRAALAWLRVCCPDIADEIDANPPVAVSEADRVAVAVASRHAW
jgi:hypothetical protein